MGAADASWKKRHLYQKWCENDISIFGSSMLILFIQCYQTTAADRSAKVRQTIAQTQAKINATAVMSHWNLWNANHALFGAVANTMHHSIFLISNHGLGRKTKWDNFYVVLTWPSLWDALQLKKVALYQKNPNNYSWLKPQHRKELKVF